MKCRWCKDTGFIPLYTNVVKCEECGIGQHVTYTIEISDSLTDQRGYNIWEYHVYPNLKKVQNGTLKMFRLLVPDDLYKVDFRMIVDTATDKNNPIPCLMAALIPHQLNPNSVYFNYGIGLIGLDPIDQGYQIINGNDYRVIEFIKEKVPTLLP